MWVNHHPLEIRPKLKTETGRSWSGETPTVFVGAASSTSSMAASTSSVGTGIGYLSFVSRVFPFQTNQRRRGENHDDHSDDQTPQGSLSCILKSSLFV